MGDGGHQGSHAPGARGSWLGSLLGPRPQASKSKRPPTQAARSLPPGCQPKAAQVAAPEPWSLQSGELRSWCRAQHPMPEDLAVPLGEGLRRPRPPPPTANAPGPAAEPLQGLELPRQRAAPGESAEEPLQPRCDGSKAGSGRPLSPALCHPCSRSIALLQAWRQGPSAQRWGAGCPRAPGLT